MDEKLMHSHAAVEIGVRRLLEGQLNITANGAATDFFGATVCRFHNAGPAPGHDCESESRNRRAHFSSELVMRIVAFDSGRAENGHTRADEVKGAKPAQEIAHHFQQRNEFFEAGARPFEKDFIRAL